MLSCKFASSGPISLNSILLTKVIVHPAFNLMRVLLGVSQSLVSVSGIIKIFIVFAISTEKIGSC